MKNHIKEKFSRSQIEIMCLITRFITYFLYTLFLQMIIKTKLKICPYYAQSTMLCMLHILFLLFTVNLQNRFY